MVATTPSPAKNARGALLDSGQRLTSRGGFASVGLSEILRDAGVPKGSFYHYFESKEAFGAVMLQRYFDDYVSNMISIAQTPDLTGAERVLRYFAQWRENEAADECSGKCLAVKLSAEVADLGESLRGTLADGIRAITSQLAAMLAEGVRDGSVTLSGTEAENAETLYEMWFGASVVSKVTRDPAPLDLAMTTTRKLTAS